ncbi:hypothetical protein VMT65_32645 [Nocardia sp. CDC153]|uniref:hypothetical protein n=1 Tax=Nocardia sp. CDC153 TaxID=3112167 RepID=UPI002DBE60DE|nr:hypothetical protein [Nocardia sp. CDC153]MEC3957823.1 hypothetical protein [Nocardia sp. CDC153]
MAAGQGSRIAVATALTLGVCAAVTAEAPLGAGAGPCGAGLGDYRGEFTAAEDPSNVLSFDGAGGIAFRSRTLGAGEGIYATIPSGGFTATLRMSSSGTDSARPDNATSMVKSVTFACPAPGTQVATFNSLDQSSRRFNFIRSK